MKNGSVVEQYKIMLDYGEELKRTNPGSTVKIERAGSYIQKTIHMFGGLQRRF